VTAGDAWAPRHPAYLAVVRGWPERALLACSGGIDSSALLVLAGIAVRRGDIGPFVVVHVDHLTRPESGAEGEAVERLAARFGLETVRETVDRADAALASSSPEDVLRALRYAALTRVAASRGLDAIITAHTRDDQVETILLRLLSGAGGIATRGMAPHMSMTTAAGPIDIHRPLLEISRAELLDVLRRTGIEAAEDPTNLDRRFRRNELRHDVIPRLSEAFPGFELALIRSATLAARDAVAVDGMAEELLRSSVSAQKRATSVDREVLRTVHPAIATRIIRWAAGRLMPGNQRELGFERIESVRLAAAGRTGAVIELPYGVVARIERTEVVFERGND